MAKNTEKEKTTTIRVTVKARNELNTFADENNLKVCKSVSQALLKAIKVHPELFLSNSMNDA